MGLPTESKHVTLVVKKDRFSMVLTPMLNGMCIYLQRHPLRHVKSLGQDSYSSDISWDP